MLLDHVGQDAAAARLRRGIYAALADATTRTRDLGGQADTRGFTDAVVASLS
jgi:isocitrate/isopropylmalate dehydrogenase